MPRATDKMNRETDKGGFLTSLSVHGEGLLHQARNLGVQGLEGWTAIQAGSLHPLRTGKQREKEADIV